MPQQIAFKTRSALRRPAWPSCAIRTSCGPGCTRSRATRRCAAFAIGAARRLPTTYPRRMSGDPGPETLGRADGIGRSDRRRRGRTVRPRPLGSGAGIPPRPRRPRARRGVGRHPANANQLVHRLRETIERSLGALLVSRRALEQRRLRRTCVHPRRLGWTLQCAYAQTHLASHRILQHLRRGASTTRQPRRPARRRAGVHPGAGMAAR